MQSFKSKYLKTHLGTLIKESTSKSVSNPRKPKVPKSKTLTKQIATGCSLSLLMYKPST